MKKIFLITGITLLSIHLFSQEKQDTTKHWKIHGETSLQASQVSLTNWAAGGESSVSGNALLNLNADYKKEKSIWENSLELGYGLLKQGEQNVRKTNDKLEFSSSYGHQASNNWYYNAMLNFKSQFAEGYDYPNDSVVISKFLAPAYVTLGIGMEYREEDKFSIMISPSSTRLIIVNDDSLSAQGTFGVDPGDKTKLEFGANLVLNYKQQLMENVDFSTKIKLFTNYLKNPENIDIDWEMFLNMKINDYLSANLSANILYDHDIKITDKDGNTGPRVQFKEVLGIGFSYKF